MRVLLTSVAVLGAMSSQVSALDYGRGDEVRVQTVDGQPASPPVQRVIAVPGDRVRLDTKGAFVNEQAISVVSPQLLTTCGKWDQTVPPGHYFLVGEKVEGESASRSCSLLPASRILGAVRR